MQSFVIKTIRDMDWMLLACLFSLALIGSIVPILQDDPSVWHHYIAFWAIGMLGFTIISFIPLKAVERASWPIYFGAILLLIPVFFMVSHHYETRRWLELGGAIFQPAEVMKWALMIVLAKWFSDRNADSALNVGKAVLFIAIPSSIIIIQPDFGMFLTIAFSAFAMIIAAGLTKRLFLMLTVGIVALLGMEIFAVPYRYERVLLMFKPDFPPQFHLIDIVYGISVTGPFANKGLLSLGKVSLQPTNTFFSALNGNGDLIIFTGLMVIYALLITRILMLGYGSQNRFPRMLSVGIAALFTYYIIVHGVLVFTIFDSTMMSTLPPLPFIGFDGFTLMMTVASMGLVMRMAIESKDLRGFMRIPTKPDTQTSRSRTPCRVV